MEVKILSVDWDYFFPCIDGFDWGHSENSFNQFYMEMSWPIRASNMDLFTREKAYDTIWPREEFRSFWDRTLKCPPRGIAIVESHSDIIKVSDFWLNKGEGRHYCGVINYDAHHDTGYGGSQEIDCGNWAGEGLRRKLIQSYALHYPSWRKASPEGNLGELKPYYEPDPEPQKFDYVFICRSAAWTPSWADPEWLEFIEWWKENHPGLWVKKVSLPYALKARSFDKKVADEYGAMLQNHREEVKAKMAASQN